VTFAAQKGGPLRVTCSSWPDAVVIPVGEAVALHVTEIRYAALPAAGAALALSAGVQKGRAAASLISEDRSAPCLPWAGSWRRDLRLSLSSSCSAYLVGRVDERQRPDMLQTPSIK
jgi:hypothetical protein